MSKYRTYYNRFKRQKRASVILFLLLVSVFSALYTLNKYRPDFIFPKWKDYQVYGIDVSKYQGDIDWLQLKHHEVSFAFIKATEGQNLIDRLYEKNWEEAAKAEVSKGAYHFYRPHVNWEKQANLFISQVRLEKGDLPPVLDIETLHNRGQESLINDMKKWLAKIEKHYGVRPIVYTYENYYNRFLLDEFRQYNLWIAKYSPSEPVLLDDGRWEFWQYSETGDIKGIDHPVDLNCFFGTQEEFERMKIK